jgi:hypothetical protein
MKMYGDGCYFAMKGEMNDNELNSSMNNTLNYMNYDMKHV